MLATFRLSFCQNQRVFGVFGSHATGQLEIQPNLVSLDVDEMNDLHSSFASAPKWKHFVSTLSDVLFFNS